MILASDSNLRADSASDSQEEIITDYEIGDDDEVSNFLAKYKDTHTGTTSDDMTHINVEMESYRGNCYRGNNILHWWKVHGNEFPRLTKLARRILCTSIPASSAASERCFSLANPILEERRSNLSGENLDAILFLHSQQK